MLWFGRNPKVPVSCFGKLKIFSDFIEPVNKTGYGQELREWVVSAVGSEGPRLGQATLSPTFYRMAWPIRDRKEIIAGALWPSRDAVGRWFPFCIFTQVARSKLGIKSLQELPLAMSSLWYRLEQLALHPSGKIWPDLEPGEASEREIQKAVMDARIAVRNDEPQFSRFEDTLRGLGALEFLEKLFSPSFWVFYPRAAWILVDITRAMAQERNLAVGLRLPASEELSAAHQAAFWLRMLERLTGDALRDRYPVVFLPVRSAAEKGIWLLFREPMSWDLHLLFGGDREHDYLHDLRRHDAPAGNDRGFDDFVNLLQKKMTRDLNALDLADLPIGEIRRAVEPR